MSAAAAASATGAPVPPPSGALTPLCSGYTSTRIGTAGAARGAGVGGSGSGGPAPSCGAPAPPGSGPAPPASGASSLVDSRPCSRSTLTSSSKAIDSMFASWPVLPYSSMGKFSAPGFLAASASCLMDAKSNARAAATSRRCVPRRTSLPLTRMFDCQRPLACAQTPLYLDVAARPLSFLAGDGSCLSCVATCVSVAPDV
mmetsp:Transcript_8248/g.25451  ORF Transcript_8248/g.25451 Transcript_8248/m.25451 type:complete len:200 (-) Transcript_8248:731-1330(-)